MNPTDKIDNLIKQLNTPASSELDMRIEALLGQPHPQTVRPMNIWSRIMKSNITKSAAAAMILIGAFIFLTQGNGTGKAFANAMEHFAAAQTARFDLTIEFSEQQPQTSTFLYDAKGYIRQNMANGTVNFVDYNTNKVHSMVPDANTVFIRKVNHLDFLHTALYDVFINLEDLIQQAIEIGYGDVEDLGTSKIDGKTAYGWRIETSPELSELFQHTQGTLTVWAEAETDMPLLFIWHNAMVDLTATVSNIGLNVVFDPDEMSITIPDDYTVQDETLPRTNPTPEPEESKSEPEHTDQTERLKLPETTAEINNIAELIKDLDKTDRTVIKAFHSWTVLTKGRFPSSLTTDAMRDIDPDAELSFGQEQWNFSFSANFDITRLFGDDWMAGIDPNDYTVEERESLKEKHGRYHDDLQAAANKAMEGITPYFDNVFKGFELINKMPPNSDCHYNGTGVELGDADTAIFWYRPDGSDIYRVIYGDLTIEDVEPEELSLLETPSPEEIDRQARDALEVAIQLGADIPEDKRAIVLRMLSLKEDDLIKGLATYLEFSGGSYPPTMNFDEQFVKNLDALLKRVYREHNLDKKQSEAKTFDISFAAFFYEKIKREKKDPAYYGDTMTVNDSEKVLVRWKISKNRYRVIFADLTRKTVTAEELMELETFESE